MSSIVKAKQALTFTINALLFSHSMCGYLITRVLETPLLIQLARLIFDNNNLSSEFSLDIIHKVFGITMGTPFVVYVS